MCIECKFLFGFCLKMVVKFFRVMKALLGIYNHRNMAENKYYIKSDKLSNGAYLTSRTLSNVEAKT